MGLGRTRTAVLAVLVINLGLLSLPAICRAGTYKVFYSNGAGCGLFTASASAGFYATVCGDPSAPSTKLTISAEGSFPDGAAASIGTTAPAGVAITGAVASFTAEGTDNGRGWDSGDSTAQGGHTWTSINSPVDDGSLFSATWGFSLACFASSNCSSLYNNGVQVVDVRPAVSVSSVTFTATENTGPTLSSAGGGNLLDQTSGYVWSPPGDPWPVEVSAVDPSGVCNVSLSIDNGQAATLGTYSPQDKTAWQQCGYTPQPTSVDTRQYVPGDGPLPITVQATNAAGVSTPLSQTVQVDNDPVTVSLATPNDANPTVWVNHPVQVTSSATAGPSGIAATSCAIDGAQSFPYPTGGFVVDGDGSHAVSCTASNNAVDPQGQPDTGPTTQAIKIDEAAPSVAFAPVNPGDPDALAVTTSDSESGVASGSITVRGPHARAARSLKTTLAGSQLLSRFDDGGKNGDYTFTATSCDAVGNCASTSETLHFPIRLGSTGLISFHKIVVPATTIDKRILVGARHRTVQRSETVRGRHRRVKRTVAVGGHLRRVRIHVRVDRRCGHRTILVRARHDRRHRRRVSACRRLHLRTVTHGRRRLGHKVKVYGLLRTKQGRPIARARVVVAARPDDRGGRYRRVLATRTGARGHWTAELPGGPSRTIRARYPGSHVVEPATVKARLTVPAGIRLRISPHELPWAHAIHIRGHLVGRYVPHDGVALRLLVRYPHSRQRTVLLALRTNRHGAFHFRWSYHAGQGEATYPFSVASTSRETDYPYAAGASRPVKITFGHPTPRAPQSPIRRG